MLSPQLLDTATLFDTLLTRAAPSNVAPIQDYEPDSYGEVPFVRWNAANNGQTGFGLWNLTLTLTVIASVSEIHDICSALYSNVHHWAISEEGHVPGVGGVVEVFDGVVFDKVGQTQIHGKHLTQYVATFNLIVRAQH